MSPPQGGLIRFQTEPKIMTALTANSNTSSGFPGIIVGEGPPLVLLPGMSRRPEEKPTPVRGAGSDHKPSSVCDESCLRATARAHDEGSGGPPCASAGRTFYRSGRFDRHFHRRCDCPAIGGGLSRATEPINRCRSSEWLGDEGRYKLRRYGDEVASGRSGARILASVLALRGIEWLMAPMLWLAHQFEKNADSSDLLATIDAEVGFDVTARLSQIRSPTLLIAGGRDRAFPLALVRATASGDRRQPSDCLSQSRSSRHHDEPPIRPRCRGISLRFIPAGERRLVARGSRHLETPRDRRIGRGFCLARGSASFESKWISGL